MLQVVVRLPIGIHALNENPIFAQAFGSVGGEWFVRIHRSIGFHQGTAKMVRFKKQRKNQRPLAVRKIDASANNKAFTKSIARTAKRHLSAHWSVMDCFHDIINAGTLTEILAVPMDVG
jgi:hypothetical protein